MGRRRPYLISQLFSEGLRTTKKGWGPVGDGTVRRRPRQTQTSPFTEDYPSITGSCVTDGSPRTRGAMGRRLIDHRHRRRHTELPLPTPPTPSPTVGVTNGRKLEVRHSVDNRTLSSPGLHDVSRPLHTHTRTDINPYRTPYSPLLSQRMPTTD